MEESIKIRKCDGSVAIIPMKSLRESAEQRKPIWVSPCDGDSVKDLERSLKCYRIGDDLTTEELECAYVLASEDDTIARSVMDLIQDWCNWKGPILLLHMELPLPKGRVIPEDRPYLLILSRKKPDEMRANEFERKPVLYSLL